MLAEVSHALRDKRDRHAGRGLGTVLAYLAKLQARGEPGVEYLMDQLPAAAGDAPTDRFRFAPGEAEEIQSRRSSSLSGFAKEPDRLQRRGSGSEADRLHGHGSDPVIEVAEVGD